MAKTKDMYSQIAYMTVTESAANTLTFAGMSVFSNILSQQGMILHRAEYLITATAYSQFNSTGDSLKFGLAGDDGLSTISQDDPEVYDQKRIYRIDVGAAAQGVFLNMPIETDFTRLPGGGMLIPADRLYLFAEGTGLAAAVTCSARVHFTLKALSAADYLELAQAMRVLK